ncbi:MAG TPA: TonB-dependent receptor plug domain-containing protein [Gemmatimonadaceae bacterium]|nr:TonB-dependent receptor plug domain-containing protein [Gemmatimonadaceae bacterium]
MNRLVPRRLAAATLTALAMVVAGASCGSGPNPRPAPADADTPGGNIEALLAGKFPGVIVKTAGDGVQILMRGGPGSFSASEEPLYILDGTPLPSGMGGRVPVSAYDIQKIEVLKNPADIAIYGMRGSNGVIRITTKHAH